MVEIHYRRLPDREQLFRQIVVEDAGEYVVTLLEAAGLTKPVTAGGRTVLEPGAPVVWITYRGRWHDVGRFHLADGTFTGVYANVLTPVAMDGARWRSHRRTSSRAAASSERPQNAFPCRDGPWHHTRYPGPER